MRAIARERAKRFQSAVREAIRCLSEATPCFANCEQAAEQTSSGLEHALAFATEMVKAA